MVEGRPAGTKSGGRKNPQNAELGMDLERGSIQES